MAFEEEPDCVDVEVVAQALAKAFDRAVVVAIAKTIALVVDDNCVEGSGANAIASAEGVAKRLAQAFAFAIAKASNQNASKAAPHRSPCLLLQIRSRHRETESPRPNSHKLW